MLNPSELLHLLVTNYQEHNKDKISSFSEEEDASRLVVDIGHLPIKKLKAATAPRPNVAAICCHVTDVRGGFGVDKRPGKSVDKWRKRLLADPFSAPDGPFRRLHLWEQAELMALFERYRDEPYHWITGQNVSVYNRRLTQRSYHGNAGNFAVGWAADLHRDEVPTTEFVTRARLDLIELAELLKYETKQDTVAVYAHRQFSKMKAPDPGPTVWALIIKPLIRQGILVADYGKVDGGLPIPNSWDADSPFNDKGRRL